MIRPRIDVYADRVDIEGQPVYKPDHLSPSDWMQWWEMVDGAPGGTLQKPEIVTLCGSTRFRAAYIDWYQRLTDQGFIVLTVGRFLPRKDHEAPIKAKLDELHLRKIDRSSRIFVLDVGWYVGDNTRREIAYAKKMGKLIHYLSLVDPDYREPPLADTDIGRAVLAGEA